MKKIPVISLKTNGYDSYMYADTYTYGTLKNETFSIAGSYSCREEFCSYILSQQMTAKSYWFLLSIGKKGTVNEYRHFIKAAEKSIGVKNTILVRKTNREGVVAICINSWWLKSKIRQQFITCLLRCYYHFYKNAGKAFDKKEIPLETILFSYFYFEKTKAAVQRFMQGYTLLKKGYNCQGWVNRFANDKNTNPEKCLVKIDAGEPDSNVPVSFDPAAQLAGASVL